MPQWAERLWAVVGAVGIRAKILGIVLGLVTLMGITATLEVRQILGGTLDTQLHERSVSVTRDLAARATDLLLTNDFYALNQLLRDTQANNADVRYAFLVDPEGQVIAHTFGAGFPAGLLETNGAAADERQHTVKLTTDEGLVWDTAVPIFDGRAGTARVGLSLASLERTVASVTGQLLLTTVMVAAIGITAAALLTWVLTRPILRLVELAQAVARGDFSQRAQRWAGDEIGTLTDAFNAMSASLAGAEQERAGREQLRAQYVSGVIAAQEDERKRIARELHDSTSQSLTSLLIGLRALVEGTPALLDPNDPEAAPINGDLLVDTELNGIAFKSGLQVIYEAASAHTLEEWAAIADVRVEDIIAIAEEFTSHGTKAVADIHRGPSQHTNGFYNNFAFYTLNALIGNFDHRGGLIKATTYDRLGAKAKGPFLTEKLTNGANAPFGIDLIRTNTAYEKSTIFEGYPAKRPWFPLATDVYQEDVPSMGDAYPYGIKVAMFYMSAIAYSLPAAHKVIETLADPKKIPLVITSDVLVGETSSYADYVFPDLSYLERWEFHGSHPSVPWKVENIRQPAISLPGWPTVKVFGEEQPVSFEALLLAVAEQLELPGFGPNGFGEGLPYTRPEHLYLKMVANLAFGEKEDGSDAVPPADDGELEIFRRARRFLPASVYDEATWKTAIGGDENLWRQVVYVLNRRGRYPSYASGWKGELAGNPYGKQINLYQEKTATSINTITGEPFVGYTTYFPPALAAGGTAIEDQGYEFTLLTYKEAAMAKARGITNYWLLALMPENPVLMNTADARRLGLRTGDQVRISSASNPEGVWDLKDGTTKPMVGTLKVVEGLRPGVVSFPLGWGHYASGSRDIAVDGVTIPGDPRRATGIHANAAMRVDPVLGDVTLTDLAGGSAVFYDSKVRVERAG